MDYSEFTGKTVTEALTKAAIELGITSDKLEYEVLEEGSKGFIGIGSKSAKIKVCTTVKQDPSEMANEFLKKVFDAMNLAVKIDIENDGENLNVNLIGDDMGMLIGKRGQTLDSLQYLLSLVVNKSSDEYLRVKLDTENYRERRKATLESLAKNIAFKVKRTRKPVSLEPMNPYERRVIHASLQDDKYVTTKSEGEEPYRHVVILLKK